MQNQQYQFHRNNLPNDTLEIPISAHIFEGRLFVKDKTGSKWLWRLLRFDGSCLTCLSSKKIKLPPHTLLDLNNSASLPGMADNRPLSFPTQSSQIKNSTTSPLVATPKNKAVRISMGPELDPTAKYYQLPKWAIDMVNISSISTIKKSSENDRHNYYNSMFGETKSRMFSIRTYDGGFYLLKANNQEDMERWIFVLSKMWKFAQQAKQQYSAPMPILPIVQPRPKSTIVSSAPAITPYQNTNNIGELLSSHIIQQQQIQPINNNPLSHEKVSWINKWAESLAELAQPGDTTSELDYGAVYEAMHEGELQTTIEASSDVKNCRSHEPPIPKRLYTDNQLDKTNMDRNFDSNALAENINVASDPSNYMNFFQDINSICTEESSSPKSAHLHDHHKTRYHGTTKGQRIRVVSVIESSDEKQLPLFVQSPTQLQQPYSMCLPTANNCSPLDNFKKRYSYNTYENKNKNNDDNVCLADVQKSLQGLDLSKEAAAKSVVEYSIPRKYADSRKSQQPSTLPSRKAHYAQPVYNGSKDNSSWHRNSWTPNTSTPFL